MLKNVKRVLVTWLSNLVRQNTHTITYKQQRGIRETQESPNAQENCSVLIISPAPAHLHQSCGIQKATCFWFYTPGQWNRWAKTQKEIPFLGRLEQSPRCCSQFFRISRHDIPSTFNTLQDSKQKGEKTVLFHG